MVKQVIPFISYVDKRFKKFPLEEFNTEEHKAHTTLYHTIRNKLDSLKEQLKRERKAAADKIKADEKKKLEEDQQEDESKEETTTPKGSKKKADMANSKSTDNKSQASSSKKRSYGKTQKTGDTPVAHQTQIGRGENGTLIIKDKTESLEELWDAYAKSKRETKVRRKTYLAMRAQAKYIHTPPSSDDEK